MPNKHPSVPLRTAAILLSCLFGLSVLTGCTVTGENGDGTGTGLPSAADETVTQATGQNTEAIVRYDYFTADVLPDVTLDASVYTDMRLTVPSYFRLDEASVSQYIDTLRFGKRTADDGDTHNTELPLKIGDTAFIYYEGSIDGELFDGGSNMNAAEPTELGIGSHSFIAGFEESCIGIVPAETSKENPAVITVRFPDSYGNGLAGKTAQFKIVVTYSVRYTVPAYDVSFVRDTLGFEGSLEGYENYESDKAYFAAFEAYVMEYLENEQAPSLAAAKSDALWTYLTDSVPCKNLNQGELDYYYNAYISELEYYYDYYTYYGGDEFTARYPDIGAFAVVYMGLDAGRDWQEQLHEKSEKMVCKAMVSHAIAESEDMESVTDEEFNAVVDKWLEDYGSYMTADDIIANMGETFLKETAFSEKMEKWLLERATFSYQ